MHIRIVIAAAQTKSAAFVNWSTLFLPGNSACAHFEKLLSNAPKPVATQHLNLFPWQCQKTPGQPTGNQLLGGTRQFPGVAAFSPFSPQVAREAQRAAERHGPQAQRAQKVRDGARPFQGALPLLQDARPGTKGEDAGLALAQVEMARRAWKALFGPHGSCSGRKRR